jgi:hypothetical protein
MGACSDGDGPSGAEPESKPGSFTISGTISVPSATYVAEGQDATGFCTVKDGYEDLRTGASVAVTDAAGDVVGVGQLVDVKRTPEECRYAFDIPNVREGSGTYGIEVGNRGIVRYQRDELDDPVEVPLG